MERIAKQPISPNAEASKIVELQNFKQELKLAGVDAIFNLLNNADFVDGLIKRILGKSTENKRATVL